MITLRRFSVTESAAAGDVIALVFTFRDSETGRTFSITVGASRGMPLEVLARQLDSSFTRALQESAERDSLVSRSATPVSAWTTRLADWGTEVQRHGVQVNSATATAAVDLSHYFRTVVDVPPVPTQASDTTPPASDFRFDDEDESPRNYLMELE